MSVAPPLIAPAVSPSSAGRLTDNDLVLASVPVDDQADDDTPRWVGHLPLRPRLLGVTLGVAGAAFIVWGVWLSAVAAVALGVVLLAGWVLDLLALGVLSPGRSGAVRRDISPRPVQAGQPLTVKLWGVSPGKRAAWLVRHYEDHTPWDDGWLPVDDESSIVSEGLPGVPGGSYQLTAARRGAASFGPARLLADSPLGLWRMRRTTTGCDELTVWPATTPLTVPPLGAQTTESATGNGLPKAHLDDTTLREYQPGDDLHRVHWPSLARTNQLMTRAEEPSAIRRTTGVLWVEDGAAPEAAELGVALLASWGEAMLRAGQNFSLSLGPLLLQQPTRPQLLDALAMVDVSALTSADAGVGAVTHLAQGRRAPADSTVLVTVAAAEVGVLSLPTPTSDGVAVAIAPPETGMTPPSGWGLVRLAPDCSLDEAALALEQGLAGRQMETPGRLGAAR